MAARAHDEGRAAAAARDLGGRDFAERDGYDDPRRTTRDPRGVPLTGPGRDTEVLR
jgi:hypothetical protein